MSNIVKSSQIVEINRPLTEGSVGAVKLVAEKAPEFLIDEILQKERESMMLEVDEQKASIIRQAYKQAEDIKEAANERSMEILRNANHQGSLIIEESAEQGYNEGVNRGREEGRSAAYDEAQLTLNELSQVVDAACRAFAEAARDQEKDLVMMALEMSKKIMRQHVSTDEEAIPKMLEEIIRENEKPVKIYLSEFNKTLDFHVDKRMYKKIKALAENLRVIVLKEEESEDIMQVETETGMIDVNIAGQINSLKEALDLE